MARLLSFPHLLVAMWVFVLLWGERWVFESRVDHCDWDRWEQWPEGSTPHHLILVADPQLTDPHSYPGRPWPINPLTVLITDNYMRRGYTNLQKILHPDTTMFLGDLFDGGREWNTAHGGFEDPEWAKPHPANEAKYVKMWNKNYGEDFWLREYARFGDIFFKPFNIGGPQSNTWQRGRKLVASLPGNHDLGFGAQVKVTVRDRFRAYFGEENRIDVIGNHTIVSVDTVSLSADTSDVGGKHNLEHIYKPAEIFLDEVQIGKREAVEKELRFWRGEVEDVIFNHTVGDINHADFSNYPTIDPGPEAERADFPTILLTHVPLYRTPGTPCGPLREHWPPAKIPTGQTKPVFPDHRNALPVSAGYQYQTVLSEEDSVKLVKKIGNVKHVFSGDDHDYCELTHNDAKENVKEITVKSISMVMGVPTPGFLMVSLWNPVDPDTGKPLAAATDGGGQQTTIQTHLCLLPNQLGTFGWYATFGFLTIIALAARAVLVPVMGWRPFALEPVSFGGGGNLLPMYKDKVEEPQNQYHHHKWAGGGFLSSGRFAGSVPESRTRTASLTNPHVKGLPYAQQPLGRSGSRGSSKTKPRDGRWAWGTKGPKIEIGTGDELIRTPEGIWKAARRPVRGRKEMLRVVVRELWTGLWRVLWIAVATWVWLNYRG